MMNPETLDPVREDVQAVLVQAWSAPVVVTTMTPFGDGHSGFTYRLEVQRGGESTAALILRLSPPGARIVGPSDVGLQGRVMRAVGAHGVPTPTVVACSSEQIVGGRAFVLMEEVAGQRWDEQDELGPQQVLARTIDAWQALRSVPVEASGLDLASARNARDEVHHWAALLPRCSDALRAVLEPAAEQLAATAPTTAETHVVHGDYHFGNLLFADGEVSAVFDWEIASLGDPLFDVAGLAVAALRREYAPEPNPTGSLDVTRAQIAQAAGVDPDLFDWYVAASCFKYAAILGYNDRLHRLGKRVDPIYDDLQVTMFALAGRASNQEVRS